MTQATRLGPGGYPVTALQLELGFLVDQSIGTVTISATAIVEVAATASITFDNFTSSATAIVEVAATLTQSIGTITPSATAAVEVHAAVSTTIGDVLGQAETDAEEAAAANVSIGEVSISATATVDVVATASNSIGTVSIAATVAVEDQASLSVTFGNFTVVATTIVEVSLTLSQSIGLVLLTGTIEVEVHAVVDATIPDFSLLATLEGRILPSPELTLEVERRVRRLKSDAKVRYLRHPTPPRRIIDIMELKKHFTDAAPGEREAYSFDYTKALTEDETLTDAEWTITVTSTNSGSTVDDNPNSHLFGSAEIDESGKITSQIINDLVAGNQYKLSALATTSEGEIKEVHSIVNCVA